MIEFEMTGRVGRDLRPDDVRIVAAREMNLRGNAIINVIDPTKSYQPTFPNADATCVIARRSIDARNDVVYRYRIEGYNHRFESYVPYEIPEYKDVTGSEPVVIVGAGPAGMFAALKLLTLGFKPVILERGKNVRDRKYDIAGLSREGVLNPESNYCYGEGGAGTFSDGKLFTRSSKRGDIREVLHQFVNFGASPQILVDAHPHIGTDRLPKVVENIRQCILSRGGEYHFGTKVTDLERRSDGTIVVKALDSENPTKAGKPSVQKYSARKVILATGHSARDIYDMLVSKDCVLEAKGFAMGVRVEHPQSLINDIRYHGQWEPGMPAAEYSFTEQVGERGVFSFCMCPGGVLDNPFTAPAQRMVDFCEGEESADLPQTSYKPGVVPAPLHELLPGVVAERLQDVFPLVNQKTMRGYYTNDALLIGVESRTSSPVRIPRNPRSCEADSFPGLLPCGEGAGYSGGIVSSAIDGINCAVAAARSLSGADAQDVSGEVSDASAAGSDSLSDSVPQE
mgnify:CR=1 FL=1